jgi:hypothetical protein
MGHEPSSDVDDTSESGTILDDTDDSDNLDGQYEKPDYVQTCWRELIRKQKGKKKNWSKSGSSKACSTISRCHEEGCGYDNER